MNKELLQIFPAIIRTYGDNEIFSSHDFINRIKRQFPTEYDNLVSHTSHHTTHASIGRLLSMNQAEMHIRKVGTKRSLTISGSWDTIHTWRRVAILLVLFISFSVKLLAYDDGQDKKDFIQQVQGWEWLYSELPNVQNVSYPYAMTYRSYASHPMYRLVDNALYSDKGDLKRISYLLRYKWDFPVTSSEFEIYNRNIEDEAKDVEEKCIWENKKSDAENIVRTICKKLSAEPLPENLYASDGSKIFYTTKDYAAWYAEKPNEVNDWMRLGNADCPLFLIARKASLNATHTVTSPEGKDIKVCFELKEKYIEPLVEWTSRLNSDTTVCTFSFKAINTLNDVMAFMVYCRNTQDFQSHNSDIATKVNRAKEDVRVAFLFHSGSYSENEMIKDIKDSVRIHMMVSDYQHNKYSVWDEGDKVKQEIEIRLGMRERKKVELSLEQKKQFETDGMKILCRHLGITYTAGMTKEKIAEAFKKKYANLDQMTQALKIRDAAVAADVELKAKAVNMLQYMKPDTISEETNRKADNYVRQLQDDNNDLIGNISAIERIDDTNFKIVFTNPKTNNCRSARIRFFSDKPFKYGYKIIIE